MKKLLGIPAKRIRRVRGRITKLPKGVSKGDRRLALFRESLERYVEKSRITGNFRERMLELGSLDAGVRGRAVEALWEIKDKRGVMPLVDRLLKDENIGVRRWAAEALGGIGDKRAVPGLVDRLLKDENIGVRRWVVLALGKIKDERAVELLVGALRDGDGDVRFRAVEALGWIGDKRVVPGLVDRMMRDGDTGVRLEAVVALGKIGGKMLEDKEFGTGKLGIAKEVFGGIEDKAKRAVLLYAASAGKISLREKGEELEKFLKTMRKQAEGQTIQGIVEHLKLVGKMKGLTYNR